MTSRQSRKMNRFFTLLLAASCLTAVGQSEYCLDGTVWNEEMGGCVIDEEYCGWQPDGNGDNLIGVNDLLDLLGVYGDTDYDQDGIWDSGDGCVGEYDECGVCNGSGPSIPIIESIEILYDSVYAEPIDEWLVFEVGVDTTFSFTCFEWQCGDPLEYQGYDYTTVLIGEQCWFAENLRSENYRNGDAIPSGLSSSDWSNTNSGAVAVYGEGSSICENYSPDGDACDASWSLNEYGRLYNWFAVDDARGLCPSGWHVPSYTSFTDFLGQFSWTQIDPNDWKAGYGWFNGENGTNSSGFSALPGGQRDRLSLARFRGAESLPIGGVRMALRIQLISKRIPSTCRIQCRLQTLTLLRFVMDSVRASKTLNDGGILQTQA